MAVLGKNKLIQPTQTAERQVDSANRDSRLALAGTQQNIELVNAHADALSPSVMPMDGLTEGYWPCDDPVGSLVIGQVLPGKAGQLTLSAGAVPGYVSELGGKCLRMYDDPVLLNVRAQGTIVAPTSSTGSLSAWFWTGWSAVGGAAQYNVLGHSSLGGASAHFLFRALTTAAGQITFRSVCATSGVSGVCDAPGDSFVSTGAWHHIGMTYNGTILILYLDGRGISSASASGNITWTTGGSSAMLIGTDGTLRGYPGFVRDIMLHTAARPREWFEEAYLRGRGRFF